MCILSERRGGYFRRGKGYRHPLGSDERGRESDAVRGRLVEDRGDGATSGALQMSLILAARDFRAPDGLTGNEYTAWRGEHLTVYSSLLQEECSEELGWNNV